MGVWPESPAGGCMFRFPGAGSSAGVLCRGGCLVGVLARITGRGCMFRFSGTWERGVGRAAPSSTFPAVAGRDGLRDSLYQVTHSVRPAEAHRVPSSAALGHPCPSRHFPRRVGRPQPRCSDIRVLTFVLVIILPKTCDLSQ